MERNYQDTKQTNYLAPELDTKTIATLLEANLPELERTLTKIEVSRTIRSETLKHEFTI